MSASAIKHGSVSDSSPWSSEFHSTSVLEEDFSQKYEAESPESWMASCKKIMQFTAQTLKDNFFIHYVPFQQQNEKQMVFRKREIKQEMHKTSAMIMITMLVLSLLSASEGKKNEGQSDWLYYQNTNPFHDVSQEGLCSEVDHAAQTDLPFKTASESYLEKYPLERIKSGYSLLQKFTSDQITELEKQHHLKANSEFQQHLTDLKEQDRSLKAFIRIMRPGGITRQMLKAEKTMKDYYVFYRGVQGKRVVYEADKMLLEKSQNRTFPEDFMFLRSKSSFNNVKQFLNSTFPYLDFEGQKTMLFSEKSQFIEKGVISLAWALVWGEIADFQSVSKQQLNSLVKAIKATNWKPIGPKLPDENLALKWVRVQRAAIAVVLGLKIEVVKEMQKNELLPSDIRLVEKRAKVLKALPNVNKMVDQLNWIHSMSRSDLNRETGEEVLSVNLSLFGACVKDSERAVQTHNMEPVPAECSGMYWLSSIAGPNNWRTAQQSRRTALETVLNKYKIPKTEIDVLEKIYGELHREDDQMMIQIFIPQKKEIDGGEMVDQIFYPSHAHGVPFHYYRDRINSSEVIRRYRNQKETVLEFDEMQGRLLVTKEGLLNPDSGIRFKVYYPQGSSQERMKIYLDKLKTWANQISDKYFK